MEQARLGKLMKLKTKGMGFPYRYEVSHQIGDIRKKYEKPTDGRKVCVKAFVKRVSRLEEGYLIRLSSQDGVEMIATSVAEIQAGQEIVLRGILGRYDGKLCLMNALPEGCQEALSVEELKSEFDADPNFEEVSVAGRLITLRAMGKALFGHIQDATGRIQVYLKRDVVGEESFKSFEEMVDTGDILGIKGKLFRTQTGELTIEVESFQILSKSLHPMPEKWHGIKDVEVRYRQRYLDLIANEEARKIFLLRSRLVQELRSFLNREGFLEVETPVLQHVASGANAKPFITYHNYLEQNLYLRIAPELYLKRLIVGGFNRVYELSKNFRNEGVDTTHNPEFTMVEFYAAFWDYTDLMGFTERLLSHLLLSTVGTLNLEFKGKKLDFNPPYRRFRYFDLLQEKTGKDKQFFLNDIEGLRKLAKDIGVPKADSLTHAKLIDKVFDLLVEDELWGPCFVMDFPKLLSPLARTHREDPDLVERFELFVAGKELANAYSELNDPIDQKERFLQQLKEREMGDEEAMQMDEDFITALEYGMPPTAGEGIGIDRLVMIIAGVDSIREVILFPALRKH